LALEIEFLFVELMVSFGASMQIGKRFSLFGSATFRQAFTARFQPYRITDFFCAPRMAQIHFYLVSSSIEGRLVYCRKKKRRSVLDANVIVIVMFRCLDGF